MPQNARMVSEFSPRENYFVLWQSVCIYKRSLIGGDGISIDCFMSQIVKWIRSSIRITSFRFNTELRKACFESEMGLDVS